jgi:hypothetical protein
MLLLQCFRGFNLITLTTTIKPECIEIQLKCETIDEVHGGILKCFKTKEHICML